MNRSLKLVLNFILIALLFYAIYLIVELPQPYGIIALGTLIVTFLFNFIKKRIFSIPLFVVGLGASISILYAASSFISYTNNQRSKFDIPTAVAFEEEDFQRSLEKAKALNKPVFIDFYTGWCTPCLGFTKNVLTDEEVGKYMNKAFVNLKYDAEKGEGAKLAKKYNVNSYPTLLVLDFNGNVLENIGDNMVPRKDDMIAVSKKYLAPEKQ